MVVGVPAQILILGPFEAEKESIMNHWQNLFSKKRRLADIKDIRFVELSKIIL